MEHRNNNRNARPFKSRHNNFNRFNKSDDQDLDVRYQVKPEFLTLFEKIEELNKEIDNIDFNNQPPIQFKALEKYPDYDDLFIEASTEIDIYKETLIRRIKTREDWNKQPKQIIEEIAGFKPSINKKLNQLVKVKEDETVESIMNIKNIDKENNIILFSQLLFQKLINEKTFSEILINVLKLINKQYKEKYKYDKFIQRFNSNIIKYIPNIENLETGEAETFGTFINNYMISNIESPSKFFKIISGLLKNYNINIFIILMKVLIIEEEKIIEVIELKDKTEIIKKKVNTINQYVITNYSIKSSTNKLKQILNVIKSNEDLYKGRNRFLYMEIKDIYKDYF